MNDTPKNGQGKKDPSQLNIPADAKAFSQAMLEENVYACNEQIRLLDEIAEHLSVISLYFRRKGESESIFTPQDLEEIDEKE